MCFDNNNKNAAAATAGNNDNFMTTTILPSSLYSSSSSVVVVVVVVAAAVAVVVVEVVIVVVVALSLLLLLSFSKLLLPPPLRPLPPPPPNFEPNHTCCDNDEITTSLAATSSSHEGNRTKPTSTISKADIATLSSICPGAVQYLQGLANPAIFRVSNCWRHERDARARYGVVYGVCGDSTVCQFLVQAPRGMAVTVELKSLSSACRRRQQTYLYAAWKQLLSKPSRKMRNCKVPRSGMPTTNQLYVFHFNSPKIQVTFRAVQNRLNVVHRSPSYGYMTALSKKYCLTDAEVCGNLTVPTGHVVMVSFERSLVYQHVVSSSLFLDGQRRDDFRIDKYFFDDYRAQTLFNAGLLRLCVTLMPKQGDKKCFKMEFSFHPKSKAPKILSSGLYNCSVDYYWRFRRHLECNLKVECEDGRDETEHCPFSSPACQGWVASHRKCYKVISLQSDIAPSDAVLECRARGATLASIRTKQEQKHHKVFYKGNKTMLTGLWLPGLNSGPFMYRHFFRWHDKTLLYTWKHLEIQYPSSRESNVFFGYAKVDRPRLRTKLYPLTKATNVFLCEKYVVENLPKSEINYLFADRNLSSIRHEEQMLSECSNGQITHAFLSCDPKSGCGESLCIFINRTTQILPAQIVPTGDMRDLIVAVYTCISDKTEIPYTLVCDFRNDCANKSDESFCQHPPCEAFSCHNSQCVTKSKKCNGLSDCLDNSDERECAISWKDYDKANYYHGSPLLIDLDGKGYFKFALMNISEPCPDTHYRCATFRFHCLPIYTRCNELYDCPDYEDERDCEDITCPGLYRCRDSTVCVHVDHVCDGWSQCPQRDDEWLCGMVCPPECLCQGHAFLCPQPFSAHLFPQLRYLDARGSGMTLDKLTNNVYLVNLNLANCPTQFLSGVKFPNLLTIDLSRNRITTIVMNDLLNFPNLQVLVLKGNPLTSFTRTSSDRQQDVLRTVGQQGALRTVDLSEISLGVLDGQFFSFTPRVQYLNVSFSSIHTLSPRAFRNIPDIIELDIRGNVIRTFSADVFHCLSHLKLVLSPHYRLCCEDLHPNKFPGVRCLARQHAVSSCRRLLASDLHELVFLVLSVLTIVGNLACLVSHLVLTRKVCIFMVNLQCANLSMGIYTSVIAAAHEMFKGQYSQYQERWTASVTCKMAGFLSLLSSEMSVVIIFLFTLDHLLVFCFPFSTCRFSKTSAAVTCVMAWFVGMLLASIPLVSGLPRWEQYGHTGICSLGIYDTPHTDDFSFFHCTAVVNCFTCVVMSAGQVMINRSMPKHQILVETSMKHVCASVDLKMKIAVTDVVGWAAITTTSALHLAGVTGSEKLNVLMAVLALPLNSAVNPLLSLWHTATYRQRQTREERLLHMLKSRIVYTSAK